MSKADIFWFITNIIFIGIFIYIAVQSNKLVKNERESLNFYRDMQKTRQTKEEIEKEIDGEFPIGLEKTIVNLGKSLKVASILSAVLAAGNAIYIIIKNMK